MLPEGNVRVAAHRKLRIYSTGEHTGVGRYFLLESVSSGTCRGVGPMSRG